jgi:outer membrane protein assembly factor BamD
MKNILYFFIVLLISSCQTKKKDDDILIPALDSYREGIEKFNKSDFKAAADLFGKVYFQHPGGDITPYAELMEAYSLYKAGMYNDSIDVIENFISIHPQHPDISYAYYLKALSLYMQISDVHHDQGMTEKAKFGFNEVISRFPETKYALDASMKLDLVSDHLAGKEMEIGRYYQKRKNPLGAINRFSTVINDYPTTSHAPEALYRITESYVLLGLFSEANKSAAVLAYNYPDSNWYVYAKNLLKIKEK